MKFWFNTNRSLLLLIIKNQLKIMADLADIQNQVNALETSVQSENTIIDSAVALINGFSGIIAGLQKQLADALASNDTAALQAVADSMAQTKSEIDTKAQTLASAVTANTPQQQGAAPAA